VIFIKSGRAPQTLSMSARGTCTHSRMISDRVTEEEHLAGKVRCLECESIVPNPHL